MKHAAQTLKCHVDNILTYCVRPITNAMSEGLNSKIMSLKRRAGGYRNPRISKPPSTSAAANLISTHTHPRWTTKQKRFITLFAADRFRLKWGDWPATELFA